MVTIAALGGTAILQVFDRSNSIEVGFRRSPERSSGPILIYYDGYYPLANSVVFVSNSVSSFARLGPI